MRLTPRGGGALLAALSELLLAFLLQDLIIATISAVLLTALLIDAAVAIRRVQEVYRVVIPTIGRKQLRVPVGNIVDISIPPLPPYVGLRSMSEWAEARLIDGEFRLSVKPKLFGVHRIEVKLFAESPLKLIEATRNFELEVVSYPKATPLMIAAAEATLRVEGGETFRSRKRSSEGEYLGSRPYMPGDTLRRFDWRATARTGKLHVKEFVTSRGGFVLIFSGEPPGPQVADFIASALLSAALAAHREGLYVAFIKLSGSELELLAEVPPQKAPALALSLALEQLRLNYEALEHVVPQPTAVKLATLRKLGLENLLKALEVRRLKVFQVAELSARWGYTMFIGSLTSSVQSVIDLAYELVQCGVSTTFILHPKPWVDARTVGEERILKMTHEKALRALRPYAKLAYTPEAAGREIRGYALTVKLRYAG